MPLIKLQTSVRLTDAQKQDLLKAATDIVSETTGKPEAYVMAIVEHAAACMAGKVGPAAFADVRGIGGLTAAVNADISEKICDLLKKSLEIPPDRVYLTFTDVAAKDWAGTGRRSGRKREKKMLKKLEAAFSRNEERYVDEWKRLVSFPSISAQPEHEQDCRRCAEWLVEHIGAMGFEARLLETPSLPCVFAAREGNPERPALLFYGHYDVQPVDPLDQWITPPFEPSVRDGRLYGRGTADNKGQHLYVLKAIETLIEAGKLEAPVKIILEGEEECGSSGTQCSLENWKDLLRADLLMVTDTSAVDSGAPTIVMGLRGVLQLTLRVTGPTHDLHSGIHGGRAPNPVQGIAEMVAGLHGPDGAIAVADFYRGVREPSPDERRLANAVPFSGEDYAAGTGVPAVAGEKAFTPQERVGFRPSIDINGIHGGYGGAGMKTIIPAEATAKITARLAAGQDPEFCLDAMVRHLEECVPEGLSAAIEDKGTAGPGLRLDLKSEAVTRAKKALGRLTDEPIAYLWEGASIPIIPALAAASGAKPMLVGFGHAEDRVHAPNESFSLERFRRGYLYAGLVLADL